MQGSQRAYDQQQILTSLPCAAEKSISGCGWERADIQRSLSLLDERKKVKMVMHLCDVTTTTDIPLPFLQCLTVCQSVAAGLYVPCEAGTGSSEGSEV